MSFVPTRVPAPPRRPGTVAISVDGHRLRGTSVDLRGWGVDPEVVVDAVRAAALVGPRPARERSGVRVDCEPAGPAHEHVRRIPPPSFDLHDALVAAARSHGTVPPAARRLERARRELRSVDTLDAPDPTSAKRRVADAAERTRRLDERVATLRGRLQASRELGVETEGIEAALADATAVLTDVETERIAAEQRLAQVERGARAARDCRQRRFRLADRVANLRRRARRELVESVYDAFGAALDALPVEADAGNGPGAFVGDPTAASLAVARVARLDAPVVLSADLFGSTAEAATRLDAPVIRL